MSDAMLSVIIPIKDTLPYFKKCLDSLVSQTCQNIEIIVVDDNSKQNIKDFVANYNDDRIIYIKCDNTVGPGGARNRGLDIASGRYIAFCDSDDWVDLNYYEQVINYMDKYELDIVMTSMKREFPFRNANNDTYMCKYNQTYSLSPEMALKILCKEYNEFEIQIVPSCMNKIYSKQFLSRINARFEEGVYFQGVLFSVYTFLRTNKIEIIPSVEYHHFRRTNSVVQSFDEKHIVDFGNCCRTLKKYFIETNTFELYKFSYYCLCNKYFNLIVQEIFEFVHREELTKKHLHKLLDLYIENVEINDLFEYLSAEEIRQHIQPNIIDTKLY